MSLTAAVTALIVKSPGATGDDILPDCPGYTREQVMQALQNATHLGRLTCVRRGGLGRGCGALPGKYYPVETVESRPAPRRELPRAASSVWAWAQGVGA